MAAFWPFISSLAAAARKRKRKGKQRAVRAEIERGKGKSAADGKERLQEERSQTKQDGEPEAESRNGR